LGDFEGRIVIGEVPQLNAVKANYFRKYAIGTKVLLRLHDPELSELFLGSKTELTLLEADATILGLYSTHSDRSRKAASLTDIENEANRIRASTSRDTGEPKELAEKRIKV
uniref:ABC transporter ATP-binding protein n=1 Tax=Gongylonema pulchrum TaxID=637853 RepID=A0A183EG34_9BILA